MVRGGLRRSRRENEEGEGEGGQEESTRGMGEVERHWVGLEMIKKEAE